MNKANAQSDAATAGRGFLVITAAKLWFMVGGALITFGLPYIFSSGAYGGTDGRALYGQYVDLNNTLSIFSMVMVTGVMQAVSKFVAEAPDRAGGIVRQALKAMVIIGGVVGGGFMVGAPWIAAWRHNPDMVLGYRAAGAILFFYGVYTVFIGTLNGRKLFFRQALYDIGFTSIKASLVLGFALLGFGVVGAFAGFATAAGVIMLLAIWRIWRDVGPGVPTMRLYAFAAQVMLYALVFNLIFKLDVVLLKDLNPLATDAFIAMYGMAVNVSRLPWQATIAITFVVFPMVSQATFADDRARTQLYIRQTLRYTMLLVGIAVVALAGVPGAVTNLLPAEYGETAIALGWLAPAYFFFSVFNVVNTLLMSAGRAGEALFVGVLTMLVAAGLYTALMPGATDTAALMTRTGIATLAAFAFGMVLGLVMLWRRFGAPIPMGTVVRVLVLGVACILAARAVPPVGSVGALALMVVVAVVFMVGLVLTREFGAEDKARLMRVIRRG